MKAQRLGTETGSLINHVISGMNSANPEVGMGATKLSWSDRKACTIIEVSNNGKTVVVQEDTAIRTDKNGISDSQTYEYSTNPEGAKYTYTLRKNNTWVADGESMKGGARLMIGTRQEFYDYSF